MRPSLGISGRTARPSTPDVRLPAAIVAAGILIAQFDKLGRLKIDEGDEGTGRRRIKEVRFLSVDGQDRPDHNDLQRGYRHARNTSNEILERQLSGAGGVLYDTLVCRGDCRLRLRRSRGLGTDGARGSHELRARSAG